MKLAPHIAPFLAIAKDDGGGHISELECSFMGRFNCITL
jgi:hypothetical protein